MPSSTRDQGHNHKISIDFDLIEQLLSVLFNFIYLLYML